MQKVTHTPIALSFVISDSVRLSWVTITGSDGFTNFAVATIREGNIDHDTAREFRTPSEGEYIDKARTAAQEYAESLIIAELGELPDRFFLTNESKTYNAAQRAARLAK